MDPRQSSDRHTSSVLLSGGLLSPAGTGPRSEEEDTDRSDMVFLSDLLSPGPGAADEFSREWQDVFGHFESASIPAPTAPPASSPPSPTSFLPSQLLDHSLSTTGELHRPLLDVSAHCSTQSQTSGLKLFPVCCPSGWATPPMFQAPPLQPPSAQNPSAPPVPASAANGERRFHFSLFSDRR